MSLITLTGIQSFPAVTGYSETGTTLRFWYSRSFQDSSGTMVQGGNGTTGFYVSVDCTVGSNITPDSDPQIYTTVDANDPAPQSIQCFARYFSNGTPKDWLFAGAGTPTGWVVYNPDPATSITFASLQLLNQANYLAYPSELYVTNQEMIDYVNSVIGTTSYASVSNLGQTYLSENPIVSTQPIAVGKNDYSTTSNNGIGKVSVAPVSASSPIFVGDNDTRLIASSTQAALSSLTSAIAGTLRNVTDGLRGVWRKVATTNLWISLAGYANVKDFGAYGDGSHDDTVAIQATINAVAAAGGGTVYFPDGTYIVGGALQDVSLSNAQLVLPKVSTLVSMITVKLAGTTPPPTPWNCDSGVILKSTLSSGNGVMIGVKNNQGSGVATASAYMSNASSNIYYAMGNITLQLPINPTNSALDISFVRNFDLRNNRIVTGDFAQGGANPVVTPGTVIPDLAWTAATTATSFGINLPTNLINNGNIDGLFTGGFFTHIRTGELTKARNLVMHCGQVGFQVEGGIWPNIFENVVIAGVARPIKVTGAKPDQQGFPDTVNTAIVYFQNMGVENDAVNTVVYIVDDANNYLSGRLSVFYGAGVDLPLNPAYPRNLVITRSERPWNVREPVTNVTGTPLTNDANLFVIDELKRGVAVSNDTGLPWRINTTNQSGTANGIGVEVFANDAIADGLDKRMYQRFVSTDGAINSAKLGEYIMNGGTLNLARTLDKYGNLNFAIGFVRCPEVALTISGNAITPTSQIVSVGAGLLKTINVPAGAGASLVLYIRPSAAFTYDSTGNLAPPASSTLTAEVNRVMVLVYLPSVGRWVPSY